MALVVWERGREGNQGAYSASSCLTTRKEQGEAAGKEPRAQVGQPRRGWAGAGRPGTLIAFGVWELPQGLGGGEVNDPGSRVAALDAEPGSPAPGCNGQPAKFREGRQQSAHSRLPAPQCRKPGRNTLLPPPQSPSPDRRRSGGQDFRTPSPQGSSPPVVPVAPVSPVFSLLGPSSRPSAQLSLGGHAKPLRFFRTTSPKATGGCGEFEARLSGMIPERAPLAAPTLAPTSRLRSGSGHGRLARYGRALMGPARRRALQRQGTGAEDEQGPRPDPAAGGWRPAAGGGGGAEGRREGGGRAGARERASERASPAPPVTHPRSLPSSSAPRSFFPESAAPPTSPAAAFNPCGLGRTRGPRGGAGGEGAGSLTRSPPAPPWLLPGHSAPPAGVLGGAFPRL